MCAIVQVSKEYRFLDICVYMYMLHMYVYLYVYDPQYQFNKRIPKESSGEI
jgi:hypothetical protein